MSQDQYLSVSQFNTKIKDILDYNDIFKNVSVKGEVSNTFTSKGGNFHFSLKDERSVVQCIIRRQNKRTLDFEIEKGMNLGVIANVTVFPPHGKYQLDIIQATEDDSIIFDYGNRKDYDPVRFRFLLLTGHFMKGLSLHMAFSKRGIWLITRLQTLSMK